MPDQAKPAEKKPTDRLSAVTTIAGTAAVTAPLAIQIFKTQAKPIDPNLWDQRLLQIGEQRDKPINTIPIIMAHNAGTDPGNSTMPISSNQDLSTKDLLDNTPTRGIEFTVNRDPETGALLAQHGADVTSLTINRANPPLTIEKQIQIIKDWADAHPDQVVVLQITNMAHDEAGRIELTKTLNKILGNTAYNNNDFQADGSKWPSINKLTQSHKNIVLLTGYTNYPGQTEPSGIPFRDYEYSMGDPGSHGPQDWAYNSEDRTMLGAAASSLPDAAVQNKVQAGLTVAETDDLINKGGLITLDHIQPNDLRLIAPAKRQELVSDPDISILGGMHYASRGVESSTFASLGIAATSSEGVGSILSVVYKSYNIQQFIKHAVDNLEQMIQNLNTQKLLKYLKNKKIKINPELPLIEQITAKHIQDYCKYKLKDRITQQVAEVGIEATSSLAGTVFAFGLLFPPVLPAFSVASLVVAGVGLAATTIAVLVQRWRVTKALDNTISDPEHAELIQQAIAKKLDSLDSKSAELDLPSIDDRNTEKASRMDRANRWLTNTILFLRIDAMAKYAIPLIGKITAAGLIFVGAVKSILDIFKNHKMRQNNFTNIPKFMNKVVGEKFNVTKKKYIFFGKSLLDQYIKHLTTLDPPIDAATIPSEQLKVDAFKFNLQKNFTKYKNKYNKKYPDLTDQELFKHFMQDLLLKEVTKDVRNAGILNTIKLGLVVGGGLSMAFPPAALLASAGVLVSSAIITPLVMLRERKKCRKYILEQNQNISEFTNNLYNKTVCPQVIIDPKLINLLGNASEPKVSDQLEKAPCLFLDHTEHPIKVDLSVNSNPPKSPHI